MKMLSFSTLLLGAAAVTSVANALPQQPKPVIGNNKRWASLARPTFSQADKDLHDFTMALNDAAWDNQTAFITSDADYGHWDTRFTIWYVPGLLYRNEGADLYNAKRAIRAVISTQFQNDTFSEPWHGTYATAPDIPAPGNGWPAEIYTSYDPNWSYFAGITLVQIVEEFEELLDDPELISEIEKSCYYASRQLMTRNGLNGDNLVPAYTNPALGRALLVSWTGYRLGDANLTASGEMYAQETYDLFTKKDFNTFGEYNVPTYYGEDVALLAQWIRHAPPNTTFVEKGTYMLTKLWEDIAEHYNYNLKNMVGPYDRVYHRNWLIDDSIVSLWFWLLLDGRDQAPVAPLAQSSTLYDIVQGSSFALLGETFRSVVNSTIAQALVTPVTEDRVFTRYISSSLDNDTIRTNTAWVSTNLMVGGQELAEEVSRGSQFTPAIAHWKSADTDNWDRPYISFFQLVASTTTINATVTPGHLSITYPNTTQSGTGAFEFLIGNLPVPWYLAGNSFDGFNNLPCLSVNVSHPGFNVSYGNYADYTIQSDAMWTVTYQAEANFTGIPTIEFDLEYTC